MNDSATATADRSADPAAALETFDPRSPESVRRLMPIGTLVREEEEDRTVGTSWGSATDPLNMVVDGPSGVGKTTLALSQMLAAAESGRGFLLLDPIRNSGPALIDYLGARHPGRIFVVDLEATRDQNEPIVSGWNPLDLSAVPPREARRYAERLADTLPQVLFPQLLSRHQNPQLATLVKRGLRALLDLNRRLPAEMQANIFCLAPLFANAEWRAAALRQAHYRERKWWTEFSLGMEGRSDAGSPILDVNDRWRESPVLDALLGASVSTLPWRRIVNEGGIMVLSDHPPAEHLLTRLALHEVSTTLTERSINYAAGNILPFHVFFDDFQSYAQDIEPQVKALLEGLRKFGAKTHFMTQSIDDLPQSLRSSVLANRTHSFGGHAPALRRNRSFGSRRQEEDHPPPGENAPGGFYFSLQGPPLGGEAEALHVGAIDTESAWSHLRSPSGADRVMMDAGALPVEERLDHSETLPHRIRHWLKTGEVLTVKESLRHLEEELG